MSARPQHFVVLDGMRGIAAIAVVAFHADDYLAGHAPHSAYLAVDFFFALSGFVLAHAYGRQLDQGLSPVAFLRLRLVRLYPLYLAGTLLMVSAVLAAALWAGWPTSKWTFQRLAISLPLALVMLPSPATVNLFPLNIPAWSLFDELIANLAYAARLLVGARAIVTIGVAAVMLFVAVVQDGSLEQGTFWHSAFPGLARVFYSFPIGIVLYRVHTRMRRTKLIPALLPMIALLGLMFVDLPHGPWRILYDVAFALVLSPLLVLLGAQASAPTRSMTLVCASLGFLSYPLYILQAPIISVLRNELRPLHGPWLGLGYLAVMVLIAWGFGIADARVRRGRTRGGRRRQLAGRPTYEPDLVASADRTAAVIESQCVKSAEKEGFDPRTHGAA
jgi:peptidoglycan/LPS O-acetylase OafA/YrhL